MLGGQVFEVFKRRSLRGGKFIEFLGLDFQVLGSTLYYRLEICDLFLQIGNLKIILRVLNHQLLLLALHLLFLAVNLPKFFFAPL